MDMVNELQRLGGVHAGSAVQAAQNATGTMLEIESISDSDISEVEKSAMLFDGVENTTADLRKVLDFMCGMQWLTAGMKKRAATAFEEPISSTLVDHSQRAYKLLADGPDDFEPEKTENTPKTRTDFNEFWHKATSIANEEGFLHWEVAFPGVWDQWQDIRPKGGFDAVIGNPPWDRIKLQEVEWFATRAPEIALQQTAAARRSAIRDLRQNDSELADNFERAKARADQLGKVIRASGDYPLLGRGDINLYSLFVERAKSVSSNLTVSSGCSPHQASTAIKQPQTSSSKSPPEETYTASSISKTERLGTGQCHRFSPMWTRGSNSAP